MRMAKDERERRDAIIKEAEKVKRLVKPIEQAFASHSMKLYGWNPGCLFHWEQSTISLPEDFVESLSVILRDKAKLEREVAQLRKILNLLYGTS